MKRLVNAVLVIAVGLCLPPATRAQGTAADYERANGLKAKYETAAIDIAGPDRIGDASEGATVWWVLVAPSAFFQF